LQSLQHGFRADRWALKAPAHMFHLQALLDEYPDALVIVTHRDLAKVLPSVASMAIAFHSVFLENEAIDRREVGGNVSTLLSHGLRHTMEVRATLNRPDQFCDVLYTDLRSDPISTIERIYTHFGLALTGSAREAMSWYVSQTGAALHGHGKHQYALADYGLSVSDIERDFRFYIDAYDIPRG
jgi:hypothetical protein